MSDDARLCGVDLAGLAKGWGAVCNHQALYQMVTINDMRKPPAPVEPPPAPLVAVYCVRPATREEEAALRGFLDLAKLAYVVA